MFKLKDFIHLPQLNQLIDRMMVAGAGLELVAGLDARPGDVQASSVPLPSGRNAIFNILLHEFMEAHPTALCIYITRDKASAKPDRQQKRRFRLMEVSANYPYKDQIAVAIHARPDLLVIDRMDAETTPLAFQAASSGLRVLSQVDSALCGPEIIEELANLGAPAGQLSSLKSILAVQRAATLCVRCKKPADKAGDLLAELGRRFPYLTDSLQQLSGKTFYRPGSCQTCRGTGRFGDISIFDGYLAGTSDGEHSSFRLSFEEYMLHLAGMGYLPLEDLLLFKEDQYRRTYHLFSSSERSLINENLAHKRKLFELGSAHEVLMQRTKALISLENMSQQMVASTSLADLSMRICRRATELCGANRGILYVWKDTTGKGPEAIAGGLDDPAGYDSQMAEVLAVSGWDPALLHQKLERTKLMANNPEPRAYSGRPPGLPKDPAQDQKEPLRAGLYVPLVNQNQQVGLMIVQSTQKTSFTQGEVALLRTLASQAALGIQRAALIEELRLKIEQLEAAQAELVQKELLERELELARQVQLSMLPRTFPEIPGYKFDALYRPARQVGGDFYDVIDLDEDHFGMVIADVSDKGLSSALYMALTRSLIRAESHRERSPRRVLERVNVLLQELEEASKFVTVFYGVVEKSRRQLTYARAGHDYPILIRKGEIHTLGGKGSVLGVLEEDELHLGEERLELLYGDRLVLYTDGLTDVLNQRGEFYEFSRLQELFNRCQGQPANQFCKSVFSGLDAFRENAEQFDDMSLLLLDVDDPG